MTSAELFYNSIHWRVSKGLNYQPRSHFPIFGNPCPQSIRITTYQSAYILLRAVGDSSIFPTKTHSSKTIITPLGVTQGRHRHRIKIRISCINYTMDLLRTQFYSVRQSKTNIFYFLIHFLSKFNKNLIHLSLGINSRIHFRTNTFDIWSHLADMETTDGRYIHVRLLTYFHNFSLRHLSPTIF
jgi:hypothetical protein